MFEKCIVKNFKIDCQDKFKDFKSQDIAKCNDILKLYESKFKNDH